MVFFLSLQVARSKDKVALTRVLGTLAVGHGERSFEDPFLHTLVGDFSPFKILKTFDSYFILKFFTGRLPHPDG